MDNNDKKMIEEYITREHAFRSINSVEDMLNYLEKYLKEYFAIDEKIIEFSRSNERMTLTILDNEVTFEKNYRKFGWIISYKIDNEQPKIIGNFIVNQRNNDFHELEPINNDKREKFTVKDLDNIMQQAFSEL